MKPSVIVSAVACLLAGCAIAFAVRGNADSGSQIRTLRQQLSQLQAKESADYNQAMTAVGSLTPPTDPLTAYNQVCSTTATGEETGITSTYWYPCTDQAQTIPQPGA